MSTKPKPQQPSQFHRQATGKKSGQWVKCPAKKSCTLENITQDQLDNIEKTYDLIAEDISYRREMMTLTTRISSINKIAREIKEAEAVSNVMKTAPAKPLSDWGDESLNEDSEEVLAHIDELIAEGDTDKMEAYLHQRGNDEKFLKLVKLRDDTHELLQRSIEEESLLYNYSMNTLSDSAKQHVGTEFEYLVVMERTNAVRDLREEYAVIQDQLNTYKNADAILANGISKIYDENADVPIYDEKTIGDLEETIDYPSGSREWLEERQKGFGGSDVGPLAAKLNPAYYTLGGGEPNKYVEDNYRETLASKIDVITDEQVEEQTRMQSDFTNPASRGNAWEGYIFHKFRKNNPDQGVMECKKSWVKKDDPLYRANFDGILTDEYGTPNGILEIKTSGIPEEWGDTSEGIYGVPTQYQAQTLHYAIAAGFDRGCVAVVIDDHEYREYHFTITETMRQHAANNVVAMHSAHDIINKKKEEGSRVYKGFSSALLKEASRGHIEAFNGPSAYRGETPAVTRARFQQIVDTDPTYYHDNPDAAYRKLFTEQNPKDNKAQYVSLDIETSDSTPARGHILEVGMSVTDALGNESAKHDQLYGLTPKAEKTTGTGFEEIHHISLDMVQGKKTMREPEEQKKVLDMMIGKTVIAHNAAYEKTWMRKSIKGFVEAERAGKIRFLDTLQIARWFSPDAPTNKLQHFTADNGIEYKDAHRAYNDAEMTKDALANLRTKLYNNG